MEGKLRVLNEGNPLRCEICHQSDCLDPETNECQRCRDIPIPEMSLLQGVKSEELSGLIIPFGRLRASGAIAAAVTCAFSINIFGPMGSLFLFGLYLSFLGVRRILADIAITGQPTVDLMLNFLILCAGLAGTGYSGLYLLRLLVVMR